MRIDLNLAVLRSISHVLHQFEIAFISVCRMWTSFRLLISRNITQSSAIKWMLEETQEGRLLIYIKNNSGSKTEPWGTPERNALKGELKLLAVTNCVRLQRNCCSHVKRSRPRFSWLKLRSNSLCDTFSKALEKSRKIQSASEQWSRITWSL